MKILIADDHQFFRSGLLAALRKMKFVSSVTEAENGREAVEEMKRENADAVFMDVNMPVMNGMDATRLIKNDFPAAKIIALTMYEDQKHVIEMIEAGASAYVIKNTNEQEIRTALLTVMKEELYFSKQISQSLIKSLLQKHRMKKNQLNNMISDREKEILALICREYTTKKIATSLFLSEKTVDWHRLNLLQKTHSKNTAGLVLFAVKSGMVNDLI